MLLADIAVEHTLVSKKNGVRQIFLLHPFTNTQRDTLGKFEIVRHLCDPGFKDVKRSAFVTFQQLAELYAKGLLEEFEFSVRMCPGQGAYPTANPVKKGAANQHQARLTVRPGCSNGGCFKAC